MNGDPTTRERYLVYRCLLTQGVLIGDEDDIWSVNDAPRCLETLRLCTGAIRRTLSAGFAVTTSTVEALIMNGTIGAPPWYLHEVSEFLCTTDEGRDHWMPAVASGDFPHVCPFCSAPAFVGIHVTCSQCPGVY